MSGMKDKAMGDYTPSRAPYIDIGGLRLVVNGGKVRVTDLQTGNFGTFKEPQVEDALRQYLEF